MTIALIVTAVLFLLFIIVYKRNKTRLFSGFMFMAFLLSAAVSYALLAVRTQSPLLTYPLIGLMFLFLLIMGFGVYVAIAYLLLNARIVFKRERRSFSNSLTLLLGLLLLAFVIVSSIIGRVSPPAWVLAIWSGLVFTALFYFLHLLLFLTTLLLCNFARPALTQDYIIILGSGLIRGRVPPLLAGRINRAIAFAQRQERKNGSLPVLLMSGGKGSDERQSEASAMREYAIGQGYAPGSIRVEDESASTRENMLFSRALIEEERQGKPYSCIFSSNNYHLLRGGIYARQAGLSIDGIGAKTALYYLPNAVLREYIAYLSMHKKSFLITALCIFLLGLLFYEVNHWLASYAALF